MSGRERRIHQGIGFDLWTGQRSWFWKLSDHGAIGAALSHPQAVREACLAIEELAEAAPGFDSALPCAIDHDRWHCALDRLARYVAAA